MRLLFAFTLDIFSISLHIPTLTHAHAACGPESLKTSLANAVANAQARVLRGEVQEIGLQCETFGW